MKAHTRYDIITSNSKSKPHRSTERRSEDRKKTRRNPRSFTRSKSRRKEDSRSKDAMRERKYKYDSHSECDDEENHLIVRLGENLTSRCKILNRYILVNTLFLIFYC